MTYRPEIDGLRAVAIISVLLFHVGFDWAAGGYIGVDVFFVISGFLITQLIKKELEKGQSFSFLNFYLRRTRRLLPALLSTLLVTFCCLLFLFSPQLLRNASASGLAALFSYSNIYFWLQADYFDISSHTKPFLHTWSLSVEEQFYIIWPIIALLLYKRIGKRALPIVLLGIIFMSFLFAQIMLPYDPEGAFFLLPSRAGELAIGGILNWLRPIKFPNKKINEILAIGATIAIVLPIFKYDSNTQFPGVNALLPCIGTAYLLATNANSLVFEVLKTRLLVSIGKISYSLYLVHWPLIVIFHVYNFRTPTAIEKISLILFSFLLAYMQYRFVEQRFRYIAVNEHFTSVRFKSIAAITVVLAGFFGIGWSSNGLINRIPLERSILSNHEERELTHKKYCMSRNPKLDLELVTCQNFRGKDKSIFIWGDSHAMHLAAGFSETFPSHNIYILYESGCVPQSGFENYMRKFPSARGTESCVKRNQLAMKFFIMNPSATVVLTSAKRDQPAVIQKVTNAMLLQLRESGVNAIWLGDFIRPAVSLVDCFSVPGLFISKEFNRQRCQGDQDQIEVELKYNESLTNLQRDFLSPNSTQCPRNVCRFSDDSGLYFKDDHHLSIHGSITMIKEMRALLPF